MKRLLQIIKWVVYILIGLLIIGLIRYLIFLDDDNLKSEENL